MMGASGKREKNGEEGSEIGSQRAKCIGRPNVICDIGDCSAAFFPVFFAASFRLSRCETRYLACNKIEPFEKAARTFGSSYFHGFHIGMERGRASKQYR